MSADAPHRPKMAVKADTPPGLELDAHGNPIPFDQRTEGDKQKVRQNIADAIHSDPSIKDPEHEAEIPAPMPPGLGATHNPAQNADLAGQQGGTKGGGKG